MISFLSGEPVFHDETLTILVNGVGYEVRVGNQLKSAINSSLIADGDGALVDLFIYTYVKEDRLELYGFETIQAKKLFTMFLGVSGVGPQTALLITDQKPEHVIDAVQNANTHFFSSLPRIGKKMAQKIIIELRSKLGEIKALDLTPQTQQQKQITEALSALGFDEQQINQTLEQLDTESLELEVAVKQAIKVLGATS